MSYVLNDSIAIYKLHEKFEDSIIDLITEYILYRNLKHDKCKHNISE